MTCLVIINSKRTTAVSVQTFKKYLTPNDVKTKLTVPTKWLAILPDFGEGHEVALRTTDGNDLYWEFYCAIRKRGRYKKPALQYAGWLKCVKAKQLRAGDKVVFYQEEDLFRGTQYRFRAQKLDAYGLWIDV